MIQNFKLIINKVSCFPTKNSFSNWSKIGSLALINTIHSAAGLYEVYLRRASCQCRWHNSAKVGFVCFAYLSIVTLNNIIFLPSKFMV